MVKIYVRMYGPKVSSGEMTIEEALELVPAKWRNAVKKELEELK